MNYQTIKVRIQEPICFLQFYRPQANNTINELMIEECNHVLTLCEEDSITVVVLEGLPNVFCFGADFQGIHEQMTVEHQKKQNSERLYDLWLKMATGPFVTVSHVRGKVNAGGIGFVAAADIVLADQSAQFSLSELLFGLFPACVLPFLIRRIGFQKSNYLTLMTNPVTVQQANTWGLVDAYDSDSENLLRKHLLRLRRLSKTGILRYKCYMSELYDSLHKLRSSALSANKEIFSDTQNLEWISKYVEKGQFPWEN
jgi:polyketide biosynthesis enoyl-CoA hydratase PksH